MAKGMARLLFLIVPLNLTRLAFHHITFYETNLMKTENIRPFHVRVAVLPHSNMLSLAASIDPLRSANRTAGRSLYSWEICSFWDAPIPLTTGVTLPANPLKTANPADMLAVLAGFDIKAQTTPALRRLLLTHIHTTPLVCGIDGGGELLARTGVLSGHRATTHWEDLETLANEFPDIDVVRDRFVQSGKFITTGGASPCIDMMLHLIQTHHGRALAEGVMRAFLYDPVHVGSDPQTLVSVSRLQRRSPMVARAIKLMETHIEDPISTTQIARQTGLSVRRLEMLFQTELATAPARYFRQLRLTEAHRMVIETRLPLHDIAIRCGFNSLAAFSRSFKSTFGRPPNTLRK
jgi:transcriptional regulator GlxA family with amidase domain